LLGRLWHGFCWGGFGMVFAGAALVLFGGLAWDLLCGIIFCAGKNCVSFRVRRGMYLYENCNSNWGFR
jgi:hypothetical protein